MDDEQVKPGKHAMRAGMLAGTIFRRTGDPEPMHILLPLAIDGKLTQQHLDDLEFWALNVGVSPEELAEIREWCERWNL